MSDTIKTDFKSCCLRCPYNEIMIDRDYESDNRNTAFIYCDKKDVCKFYCEDKKKVEFSYKKGDKMIVLDKVRTEIENDWQLKKYPSSPFSCGLRRVIEIIDKYKAESEE